MTAKVQFTVSGYVCQRCGHQWVPRKAETPKVCSRCKSPYWSTPRTMPPRKSKVGA